MQLKQKYIITEDGRVIIFSELMQHKEFKHFNPIRAGFVTFYIESAYGFQRVTCETFGESISLDLKSNKELDERIIKKEILGFTSFDL
jgi:hypothetical protein